MTSLLAFLCLYANEANETERKGTDANVVGHVIDRRFAEKAREIQSVLRQENGLENAAEIIEAFAKF